MKSLARTRTGNKSDKEAIKGLAEGLTSPPKNQGDDVQKSVDGGVHQVAKERLRDEAVTLSQTLVGICIHFLGKQLILQSR